MAETLTQQEFWFSRNSEYRYSLTAESFILALSLTLLKHHLSLLAQ
ncbi:MULTISPECIES: hypothetical protein [unclassified Microcystis]|jgi:hypothetical protein|nr:MULTISPECIES: hypothetical protein [unclassified Microcystis]MCA2762999.1 hypothetical protein [Microcystis sp. M151S2]NCQ71392.1 hypothetical protein [Microcystis aeruginosa W13-16]NCQ75131.1 hypothetical protein [Microcystis aeruginosa W13-13]NCQ80382.1 hypothetical protein [Microcystis aeruginosa W13-15]NCS45736.1 hypothetical protein [Microcystis aeruginosa BS11-05]NCS54670.1 hypothetical protein [Microcystis aeruginosa G13-05]